MRHRIDGRKLGRTTEHRKAMLKNLVRSLFEHERIVTTVEKAKEARRLAERLITVAKEKNLHTYRMVSDALRCTNKFDPAPAPEPDEKKGKDAKEKEAELRVPPTRRWDIRIVKKLFDEIAPRYRGRSGGYTRILRLAESRKTDGASRVLFELIDTGVEATH